VIVEVCEAFRVVSAPEDIRGSILGRVQSGFALGNPFVKSVGGGIAGDLGCPRTAWVLTQGVTAAKEVPTSVIEFAVEDLTYP
jgi:hypothetical protein